MTGGLGNNNVVCNMYEAATGTWTQVADMNFPRYEHSCMAYEMDGKLNFW